jgi:hypothetical protein
MSNVSRFLPSRGIYIYIYPQSGFSDVVQSQSDNSEEPATDVDLKDEDFLLAPTVLHGFSLSDKLWCKSFHQKSLLRASGLISQIFFFLHQVEFNVEKVQEVEWNENAFDNLVIPSGRKHLLRSLVEAHHKEVKFDDFIKGKGQGLVINLFGPPGVGESHRGCLFFQSQMRMYAHTYAPKAKRSLPRPPVST